MKVYVAAASCDLERAKQWMEELRREGIEVTSDWPEVIEGVGIANPRDASRRDRGRWSAHDLLGVAQADVFWFLVHDIAPARGAYVEMGYALRDGAMVICSGDTKQSIFCARGEEYEDDREAFERICLLAQAGEAPWWKNA
jgi:hypothetical protein